MPIAWRDAMALGEAKVDEDHKKYVALINATENFAGQGQYAPISLVLQKLTDLNVQHFAREEALMANVGYLDIDAHKALHEQFSKKVKVLSEKFSATSSAPEQKQISAVVVSVLNDYFMNHILKEDLKLKPFMRKVGQTGAVSLLTDIDKASEQELEKRRANRNRDVEYQVPPQFAHLLQRLEYAIPQPPPPLSDFPSFASLCEAAICRRVDKILVFFQRKNLDLVRELPPIFLASPEFAEKFHLVVNKLIFPVIWESRQVRMVSTSFDWSGADAENFWDNLTPLLKEAILNGWSEAWDGLRLVEVKKEDGTRALQVREQTKILRAMLAATNEAHYDLPKVGNREIEVFKSLLDTNTDWWTSLNNAWRIVHDLYEQEKDPRVFQQKAREGALRDNLLYAFQRFPEIWGDFMVLACHRVFPRISSVFLESFATNFGRSEAEREGYVPYTIRYLRQVREHPSMRERERGEEDHWQSEMKKLRDYLAGRTPAPDDGAAK